MALAVAGFVVLRRRGQPLFILLAPFALVLIVSVTSYGILRFRAPADVALVVLGAVALDALLGSRRSGAALGGVRHELSVGPGPAASAAASRRAAWTWARTLRRASSSSRTAGTSTCLIDSFDPLRSAHATPTSVTRKPSRRASASTSASNTQPVRRWREKTASAALPRQSLKPQ